MKTRWVVVIAAVTVLVSAPAGYIVAETIGGAVTHPKTEAASPAPKGYIQAALESQGINYDIPPASEADKALMKKLQECKYFEFEMAVRTMERVVDDDSTAEGYIRYVQEGGFRELAYYASKVCDEDFHDAPPKLRYASSVLVLAHALAREKKITPLLPPR